MRWYQRLTSDDETGSAAAPAWRERRDLYPHGVASGDPAPDSVLLWTRRQPAGGDPRAAYLLSVELAKDQAFHNKKCPGLSWSGLHAVYVVDS